jgi:hypothetical protein
MAEPGKSPSANNAPHWDAQLGEHIYRFVQGSSGAKLLCEIFTLLVDESVCLTLLVSGWFSTLALRANGYETDVTCLPEAFVDCYLLFMTWSVMETVIKLVLRQPRPAYGKQKPLSDTLIPGDQYSFPSGHSLRAFAMARVASQSPSLGAAGLLVTGNWEFVLLAIASVSAFSRIGLGRHSPLDVIAGSTLGFFVGGGFWLSPLHRFHCQLIAATYYACIGFAAITSGRARTFLGIQNSSQVATFLALPMWGSWTFVAGRFDGFGSFHADQPFRVPHHVFGECGVPPEVGPPNELLAGLSMFFCAFGLLGAAFYAGGGWWILLPAGVAFAALGVELLAGAAGVPSLLDGVLG